MILSSLLSSSSFIMTNKILIKAVGTDAAIIIGELCSEYNYWEQREQLLDGEWFYSTRENIEENTGISEHRQRIAIGILVENKLIETRRMGIPCKMYYKLNEANILECYSSTQKKLLKTLKNSDVENFDNKTSKSETSSSEKNQEQVVENLDINNNNNKNNNKNNNNHTHEQQPVEEKKEYASLVAMTEKEYNDLVKEFGESTTKQLIEQLSLYKQAHGKSYDSDYAAILLWVTTRLREMEKEDAKYKEFKNKVNNKSNFSQREYPPGFFDNLYSN